MRRSKIRTVTIVCWGICAAALIGLAVWGLTGNLFGIRTGTGFSFTGGIEALSGPFEARGSYTAPAGEVSGIAVEWYAGDVAITPYDGTEITFSEYARRALEADEALYYVVQNGTLIIHYREKQIAFWSKMPEKKLDIFVPEALAASLTLLRADTISGSITVTDIGANTLEADTASGAVTLDGIKASQVRLNTVSGEIRVADMNADTLSLDTASGTVHGEYCMLVELDADTVSGNVEFKDTTAGSVRLGTASGRLSLTGSFSQVDADSISGSVEIESAITPAHLNINTTSGRVTLTIPDTDKLSVSFDSISGTLSSEIPVVTGGQAQWNVDTISGNLEIKVF